MEFYSKAKEEREKKRAASCNVILISNGKSSRDLPLFEHACAETHTESIVISDVVNIRASKQFESGVRGKNGLSYKDMLNVMATCDINVIPILQHARYSLCGLTSVLDSVALGMPIIISDNSNVSIDFEKEGMGISYKTGKIDSLVAAIQRMSNSAIRAKAGDSALTYSLHHNYETYCKQLGAYLNI